LNIDDDEDVDEDVEVEENKNDNEEDNEEAEDNCQTFKCLTFLESQAQADTSRIAVSILG
jgi:hypothetical protein